MKIGPGSALGLVLLAASLTFSSSFACPEASETIVSASPTVSFGTDATLAGRTSTKELLAEVDQPASVSAIEPSGADESAGSAIHSVDAIVVEITQSVTVIAPEIIEALEADATVAVAEVDQPATVTTLESSPSDASAGSAVQSGYAIVVEITQSVTVAVPGETTDTEIVD